MCNENTVTLLQNVKRILILQKYKYFRVIYEIVYGIIHEMYISMLGETVFIKSLFYKSEYIQYS